MKLTKIESYEIQAFAFRVMTGYVAPGKDASPLADEAPYEERCAAFDEWRNEHAPCILAMLHGFEALIDRDDEPTRALLDRLNAAEAENERLREFELSAALTLPGVYYMDPPDGGTGGNEMTDLVSRLRKEGERCDAEACFTAADEITRLRAELAEARKPDCRTCAYIRTDNGDFDCGRFWIDRDFCVNGNKYKATIYPLRLYEKEGKV